MSIVILFSYISPDNHPEILYRNGVACSDDGSDVWRYSHYLAGTMNGGVTDVESCDEILAAIKKIEKGEETSVIVGDNDFNYEVTRDRVQISIINFEEWDEQPEGVFSLEEFKRTIIGWREFRLLPESSHSRVIVPLDGHYS